MLATMGAFKRRRATELKHGRISMLATMGYITPEITGKFPGYLSPSMGLKYSDIPNGLGAISKVPAFGWFQIVFYCLFVEYQSGFGKDWKEGTPGEYITPEITGKFPGYLSPSMGLKYSDIPNGLGAISKVPAFGWFQIVFYCLFVEYQSGFGKDWKEGTPGDLGWKMLSAADPGLEDAVGRRSCREDEETAGRACKFQVGDDCHHGHVLPERHNWRYRADYVAGPNHVAGPASRSWRCMGLRERAWRPGASWSFGILLASLRMVT
eukprot:TRINITY_DN2109_c0_g1_i7.p1 TRINITY_DN2109_c0_g1~~TRINITY_DN2109_c0_g1_i7.p1  ORF type:complete len:266 (-),score=51.67 TRINITY_DN2109_c0_g1_i7:535-1332(-)